MRLSHGALGLVRDVIRIRNGGCYGKQGIGFQLPGFYRVALAQRGRIVFSTHCAAHCDIPSPSCTRYRHQSHYGRSRRQCGEDSRPRPGERLGHILWSEYALLGLFRREGYVHGLPGAPGNQRHEDRAPCGHRPWCGNPTGQVFNGGNGFNNNLFLFVSEDGTISGWRGASGTTAETLQIGSSNNLYKGAAIATISGNNFLYAANFKSGAIDVLKGNAAAPDLTGNFTDPNLPSGYKPFNVQTLGEHIYVAYAQPDPNNPTDGSQGRGAASSMKFDRQGGFQRRIATQGVLDAPWAWQSLPPPSARLPETCW